VLIDLLYESTRAHPRTTALVYGDERISYAELVDRVERLADGLARRGIRAGDAVALLLPNGPGYVASFFALAGLGAVAVPLNPQFKRDELEFCFRRSGVRAVICDDIARPLCAEGLSPDDLIAAGDPVALAPRGPDEALMQQYSSGSTGRPKRLVRTHGQCWAEAHSYTWVGPQDRILCAVPLFHTYGLGCCLLTAVRNAATLVLMEEPHPFLLTRGRALDLLEREAITVFPGVPFNFRLLADAGRDADLSALRLCFSAGTALARETFDAFLARLGVPVRQLYGCTEAGTLTANLDPDPVATFASVGAPVGDVRVQTVDGEVVVSSPALTRGYADIGGEAFRDGWFSTGDLGRLDDDGRLYITGRKKLLIEVAGHKVDPVEVEDVVISHPDVRDAVVVGVNGGPEGEERVKAVVVMDGGPSDRELIRFCGERLAAFKVPQIVERRDEIPKSPLGKVLRKYLL
jgi:long-chain acyl-CoA synthetase